MAPLAEIIGPGSGQSGTFNATNGVSDVMISGSGMGQIQLKMNLPGVGWMTVTNKTGVYNIATPDAAAEYAVFFADLKEAVNIYLGP